ncbi:hypothetical protein [Nocardioides coralli]|uniref:hypothetical protein n=1 Tax=Nocardioides coralli TaxID=2872154 RepID=UPI001CA45AB0|nr:hypothetical protein [Nocardioides coralli]QZY28684.1 hypothetical protein K6T13_14650 [Nocardioides coralli]
MTRHLLLALVMVGSLLASSPAHGTGPDPALEPDVYVNARHWMAPTALVEIDWFGDEEVAGYDVRVSRTDPRRGRRSPWARPARLQGGTDERFRLPTRPGSTLCVTVRGHTAAGSVSTWSDPQCSTRAFPTGMLRREGRVSAVRDDRMWGGRALVTRGAGRVVLPGLRHGNAVGFLVTLPRWDGRQRGYEFTTSCARQPRLLDVNERGDRLARNRPVALGISTRVARCRLVFHRAEGTGSSFPLQGLMVWPRWR